MSVCDFKKIKAKLIHTPLIKFEEEGLKNFKITLHFKKKKQCLIKVTRVLINFYTSNYFQKCAYFCNLHEVRNISKNNFINENQGFQVKQMSYSFQCHFKPGNNN